MYDMPNHRERRRIAKQLGLLKTRSKLPFKKYFEEISRSITAGNEIHRVKTENMLRDLEEQEAAIEAGRSTEASTTISVRKETIDKIFATQGETRSYNEISADYELQNWRKRFSR